MKCPIEGCSVELKGKAVMCSAHWARVPYAMQKAVVRSQEGTGGRTMAVAAAVRVAAKEQQR